jgi:AcrR family transcriptional regulator
MSPVPSHSPDAVRPGEAAPRIRPRAQRLPADQRRSVILTEAASFFAEHGFAASTRDLADRLGVRQALLYKYFSSKEALIEAIFAHAFTDHWSADWIGIMTDRRRPLLDRLCAIYSGYLTEEGGLRMRLYMRAALEGWPLPRRVLALLIHRLFRPLVCELRQEDGLPGFQTRAMMIGEFELAMMLHWPLISVGLREHVLHQPVSEDRASTIRFHVSTFLGQAFETLRGLHSEGAPDGLSAPLDIPESGPFNAAGLIGRLPANP